MLQYSRDPDSLKTINRTLHDLLVQRKFFEGCVRRKSVVPRKSAFNHSNIFNLKIFRDKDDINFGNFSLDTHIRSTHRIKRHLSEVAFGT